MPNHTLFILHILTYDFMISLESYPFWRYGYQ